MYLNNVRYFLRGCGDDHVYPITVCSPASREEHVKHLRIVKQYGFNYIRLHTHCEIPEYFEAADEVGMMVQPELPYYGRFSAAKAVFAPVGAPLMAKDDLVELVTHMRRYTSLATYCGGNEGESPTPLDRELYRMAKSLDCVPALAEHGRRREQHAGKLRGESWGIWMGVCATEGKRLAVRETRIHEFRDQRRPSAGGQVYGAYAPNQKLRDVKTFVTEQVGLDWKWADACFDAGHRIQGIWHKIGIEAARVDPYLDGFICWLMVDLSPSTQCGVLDMFWGKKSSTPEYFRQFNAPTVILARTANPKPPELLGLNPATLIYTEGDALDVDWVVSHFQPQPLKNATLAWQLVAGEKTLASGKIEKIDVAAGTVPIVGRSRITMPAVSKAVRARLIVELEAAQSRNSWDIWLFPQFSPHSDGGQDMAASPRAFNLLASRYPGLAKLGTPEADTATIVVARGLEEPGVLDALKQGKSVICLSLPGYNLAPAGHGAGRVVGQQPNGHGHRRPSGIWRLPQQRLSRPGLVPPCRQGRETRPRPQVPRSRAVDGRHRPRDRLQLRHARLSAGIQSVCISGPCRTGKLLATGLNLAGDNPEAVYLLDQFIRYARSDRFAPQGTFDIARHQQEARRRQELCGSLNGWAATLRASERTDWHSFLCTAPMCVVRQTDGHGSVAWRTGSWKPDDKGLVTFRWIANLGWQSQPAGGRFSLWLNHEKLLDFDITLRSTTWKSADGSVMLKYTVKSIDRDEDSSGIMELIVPGSRLPNGGEPVTLRVDGSTANSRRYFGLQEISP